ncbi:MAG: exodeoxyribonuclease VII small subunit [Aggregatilineales bacterium]
MTADPLPPNLTFEQAYQELESIVTRLEAGNLSLDESLTLFERGQRLSTWCEDQLNNAELRITQLSDTGEELEDEPPE